MIPKYFKFLYLSY